LSRSLRRFDFIQEATDSTIEFSRLLDIRDMSGLFDLWAYANGVILDFSRPGKPTDNAFIDCFNARVRLECLNQHWFQGLDDA
jgi:transposase InsO family protein